MSGVVTAVVGTAAVGGLISSKVSSDAANKASREQRKAAGLGVAAQEEQFDKLQALLQPYVSAGNTALQQQMQLIGLAQKPTRIGGLFKFDGGLTTKSEKLGITPGMTDQEYGAMKQQEAIQQIAQSPELQAMTEQGEEAIMRNAAATGGLRSGNVQGALAQYRPAMLQQAIDRRYSQLSGLTGIGQASAAGVGAAGQQMGANVSNLYQQAGAAQAGSALAQGQAQGQMWSGLGQAAGMGLGAYLGRPQTSPYPTQAGTTTVGTYEGQPIRVW